MSTALLVIDVQNILFKIPNSPVYRSETMLQNIRMLIDQAKQNNIPVIYVHHNDDQYMKVNTEGWKYHPMVAPTDGDIIVHKRTPDSFHETTLKEELDRVHIDHLVIAGMQTEYCVDTTCRRASSLGYRVTLVGDAHSTIDSPVLSAEKMVEHHNFVLGNWFCQVKDAEEVSFGEQEK
jgi:nicotinamidase-related amidase